MPAVVAAASVSNADDVGHPHPLTLWGVKSLLMTGVQIFFLSKKAEKKNCLEGQLGSRNGGSKGEGVWVVCITSLPLGPSKPEDGQNHFSRES